MPLLQGLRFGFSGLFSVMLIILMLVMLVGIVAALLFGTMKIPEKSAFFSPVAAKVNVGGKEVIRIDHRGGDVLSLIAGKGTGTAYPITVFIQIPSAMAEVRVAPSTQSMSYRPGDAIYVYHTSVGYFLSDTGAAIHPDRNVSEGTTASLVHILIVDRAANISIARLGPF
jgi:hypothetical protein